jgi:sugar phosphate isomerase/epimerase
MFNMIDSSIVCAYLYIISQYGYPPPAKNTFQYLEQMKALGFKSVELEGIRRDHLLEIYRQRNEISSHVKALGLQVPTFASFCPAGPQPTPTNERRICGYFARDVK